MTAAALLAAAVPASAAKTPPPPPAPKGLHFTDAAGDANGVNSQGFGLPVPSTSTSPLSVGGADIVGVDVVTLFKKVGKKQVPNGTALTLKLAAPVQAGVLFTITANVPSTCDGTDTVVQLGYGGPGNTSLAVCQAPAGKTAPSIGTAEVDAAKTSITWTFDATLKPGQVMTDFSVTSSVFVFGVFDESLEAGPYTYAK